MTTPLMQALAPTKMRPWHELVIDMWLIEPTLTQRDIAAKLGKSEFWLSVVVNGDAFKERFAQRKGDLVDPTISAQAEDKLRGLVSLAADKLGERISAGASDTRLLLGTLTAASRALGMGASSAPTLQNNLYFLPPPPAAVSAADWSTHSKQAIADAVVRLPP